MSFSFKGKTIIIISQQDWGKMFISKHHYAVTLAKAGSRVYFLNSPEKSDALKSGEVRVEPTTYDNLNVIKHRFFYPYIIKHKFKALHNLLLTYHIKNVLKKVGGKVDVVWSFDVSNTIPLRSFPQNAYKIFMPVDEPKMPEGADGAIGANVLFSVTEEIISKYDTKSTPALFVNHGVADIFIGNVEHNERASGQLQIGLSGNFLRPDIDWPTLKSIIIEHPDITFNFWGAYNSANANLSDSSTSTAAQPEKILKGLPNAVFHGAVDAAKLAGCLKEMDAFLICYDIDKDQSGGTNYHKVLEYIATGKVIVSNNITTYASLSDLVTMPVERNNKKLPELFSEVINNLQEYNSPDKQQKRIVYAQQHSYANNIRRIEDYITSSLNK